MRFWWVNHNQTARQEVEGGFLWSPKRESGGARSRFYDNMREAAPGDLVLSYSRQAVRFVGQVTDYAFTALKPPEFGSLGSYWEAEGWLLPVSWIPVEAPVSPKTLISTLGPMLPEKYSPIHRQTGAGNQKAYLAEVPPAVFQIVALAAEFRLHRAQVCHRRPARAGTVPVKRAPGLCGLSADRSHQPHPPDRQPHQALAGLYDGGRTSGRPERAYADARC